MQKDKDLTQLAATQFGVFSRRQATEGGLSPSAISRRTSSGAWVRVLPAIYRLNSAPPTWQQLAVAAWLWAGRDAVLSHRAAAKLWELDGAGCDFAELWVPTSVRSPSSRVRLHVTNDLRSGEVQSRGPFRVTRPTRTLIDLASVVEEDHCRCRAGEESSACEDSWPCEEKASRPRAFSRYGCSGCSGSRVSRLRLDSSRSVTVEESSLD